MLHAVVLGAAAGGGFPQWNSNTPACREARQGSPRARARTPASLAVSANHRDWFLLNASLDLRLQIEATPVLHPRDGLRSSPIVGVVVTGGDVDAIAGLLHLRERHRFTLYAPRPLSRSDRRKPHLWGACARNTVRKRELLLGEIRELAGASGDFGSCGARLRGTRQGAALPRRGRARSGVSEAGDAIGLELIDTADGGRFFFIPGCARMSELLRQRLAGSSLVFFDGTLWRDDEMIRMGIGEKTGQRMGHISMSGAEGAIAVFRNLDVQRRIFIHINNSNPVLPRICPSGVPPRQPDGRSPMTGWR